MIIDIKEVLSMKNGQHFFYLAMGLMHLPKFNSDSPNIIIIY